MLQASLWIDVRKVDTCDCIAGDTNRNETRSNGLSAPGINRVDNSVEDGNVNLV